VPNCAKIGEQRTKELTPCDNTSYESVIAEAVWQMAPTGSTTSVKQSRHYTGGMVYYQLVQSVTGT
jgi:hypothetical protein